MNILNKLLCIYIFLLISTTACIRLLDPENSIHSGNVTARKPFQSTSPAEGISEINLENINGNVTIQARSDVSQIIISGERQVQSSSMSDAEAHLSLISVKITPQTNKLLIQTEQPDVSNGRTYAVNYKIQIPSRISANILLVNGSVEADSMEKNLTAVIVNGNLSLSSHHGDIFAQLVNGQIVGHTIIRSSPQYRLNITNGNIQLSIPSEISARLSASANNGNVELNSLVLSQMQTTPTSIQGTLGAGAGMIQLTTVNGQISVTGY